MAVLMIFHTTKKICREVDTSVPSDNAGSWSRPDYISTAAWRLNCYSIGVLTKVSLTNGEMQVEYTYCVPLLHLKKFGCLEF